MKECPKCGNQLNDTAKFCGKCGEQYEEPKPKNICIKCGAKLKEGAKFCTFCGTSQSEKESNNGNANDGNDTKEGAKIDRIFENMKKKGKEYINDAVNYKRLPEKKKRKTKAITIGITIVIAFLVIFIWSVGPGIDGGKFNGNAKIIEVNDMSTGAVYDYTLEETITQIDKRLSNYYGENISLEKDFTLAVNEQGTFSIYGYTSKGDSNFEVRIMVAMHEKTEKLFSIIVDTKVMENSGMGLSYNEDLGSIQEIFAAIINPMIDTDLTAERIKKLVKAGETSEDIYIGNNVFQLCRYKDYRMRYTVIAVSDEAREKALNK